MGVPNGRTSTLWVCLRVAMATGALAWGAVASRGTEPPPRLSLVEAKRLAFERSPSLLARRASVAEARGRVTMARTYPFNPEVEGALARRKNTDARVTDYEIELSQEVELAGQRGKRAAAAEAELSAVEAAFLRDGRRLAAQVEQAFAQAVRAGQLLAVDEADERLATEFLSYARRRFEAGAASQIELNLAAAAAGRAARRRLTADAVALAARSGLAEVIGLEPANPPEIMGELLVPEEPSAPLSELVAGARERRADLRALRETSRATQARLRLASAEAVPNLKLGGFYNREDGTDDILGARVAISLPLFNRNQGGVAEARARLDRTAAEEAAGELTVEREVTEAWAAHSSAREAAIRLRRQVIGSLEENLDLLQRALEAGKLGAAEVLLFRREFVEARREYVEAAFEAWSTRIALDLAAGRLPDPAVIEEVER